MKFSRFAGLSWSAHVMAVATLFFGLPVRGWCEPDSATLDFSRDIRPILSDKCFQCHGPDEAERATALRLDQQVSAFAPLDSGDHAIVPGDSASSILVQRIFATDADDRMPPPHADKHLSEFEKQQLRTWIDEGASWKEHWAFVSPIRPSLPQLSWPARTKSPIDRFVMRRLFNEGLEPSRRADRATLIRRVTLDLTGIPPTTEEVDDFVSDSRPDAYERLVDRLLASPRFGERQARFWLDVARYGDTHGLHLDNERSMWPYRDWVIQAFNANQPFDQFTVEQLAGDLLPTPSLDQLVATGFNRCNVTTSEGGSIDEEYLVRYAVDRVETTSTVWLGLTTGCAVCHDHKFDPISQREFYQLFSYFYSLTERAMDGNALVPPPSVKRPTYVQQQQMQALQLELAEIQRRTGERRAMAEPKLESWIAEYRRTASLSPVPDDALIHAAFDQTTGDSVEITDGQQNRLVGAIAGAARWDAGRFAGGFRFDGSNHVEIEQIADFERDQPFSVSAWIYIDGEGALTILSKMDDDDQFRGFDFYIGDQHLFVHLIHRWPDNAIRVNTSQRLGKSTWHHVAFRYDGSGKASGVDVFLDGELQSLERTHDTLTESIRTSQPLRFGRRRRAAPFRGILDELRVYRRSLLDQEVQSLAGRDPLQELVDIPAEQRSQQETDGLLDRFLTQKDPAYVASIREQQECEERMRRLEASFPSALIMEDMSTPRTAHLLHRGQYDQPRDPVEPAVPAVLPPLPGDAAPNRLSLARWLVSSNHPLTARVTVNRVWQQYFGSGLVATSEDFGSQGSWPSHPELLDWLAVEFVETGWNVKLLHRLIVTSETYQQTSEATPEAYRRDPENRLLARGPRYRLDAETLRNQALAVGGLLTERLGGPSVRPYQPAGLWEVVGYTSSNTSKFKRDDGESLYRRSLYTFWKRTSPPPTMQIFDAPSREVCVARRPRTNTPAQALALMNDVQFVEAARGLAVRVLKHSERDEERLSHAFRLATARAPSDLECQVLLSLLHDFRQDYVGDLSGAKALLEQGESTVGREYNPVELAAWTMVANTILNLDETISKW